MENMAHNEQNRENEIVIKQDTEDGVLQVLLKEYELTLNRLEGLDNRSFQFLTVALTILGFLAGYVLQPNVPVLAAWLIPLFCLTMYMLLIFFAYSVLASFWNAKILSQRINTILPEIAVIHFGQYLPESTFFSTRRGNPKVRWLYLVLFGGSVLLFPPIVAVSFNIVYQHQNHFAGSVFVIVYALLVALVLYISSGLIDLPNFYRTYVNLNGSNNFVVPIQPISQYSKKTQATSLVQATLSTLIPRSWDILAKGPFFIYGIVTALIVVGFSKDPIAGLGYRHLDVINFLFSVSKDWKSIPDVPIWAILALVAIYFTIEEILLQQAKLLWDDIRDVERDSLMLLNNKRPIVTKAMSISSAIRQMIVRWMLALVLGYLLGGINLLIVFLLISFHQAVYVLWAKPRSAKHPKSRRQHRELLFVLSFNLSLRFLAGVVAVVGSQWSLSPFVLFFVLFYFCSLGSLAAFWKMEADYQKQEHEKDKDKPLYPRPQSEYYLNRGEFWQHVGLVAAVLFGSFMVIVQFIALRCNTKLPALDVLYGQCRGNAISYQDLGIWSVLLILGLIATFMLVTTLLISLFGKLGKLGNLIVQSIRKDRTILNSSQARTNPQNQAQSTKHPPLKVVLLKIKQIIMTIFFIIAISLFLKAALNIFPVFVWNTVYALFWGFLFLNAGYILMFEGMTYLEYTSTEIWNRIPSIRKAWYYFLFDPTKPVGLKELKNGIPSDNNTDLQ